MAHLPASWPGTFLRVCLGICLAGASDRASTGGDDGAVRGLIERVVGESASGSIVLETVPRDTRGREVMGLGSSGGKVLLRGSSQVALASALNWYLNDHLNTTYDWSTYEAIIPEALPLPPSASRPRVVELSYHLNVCTDGYSLAFADWPYWEKHLDWMAMQGINLPLAFLGQERVMELTFARFNVSFEEMQHFFGGPGFLPWYRMGNIQAWGGPLSRHWIDGQVELQRRVLARMRAFGMRPVLPAFAGFLPPAFVQKHPQLNVTHAADWADFPAPWNRVAALEPTDPMFIAIGRIFIEEQTKLFGTDHIYQCDTYNEMLPRSGNLDYLKASSRAVMAAMRAGDPQAVWLMQGWLFLNRRDWWTLDRVQAYLDAVPNESMWILDLSAASDPVWQWTHSFFGKRYLWNTLYNYGGQQGVLGNLPQLGAGFQAALRSSPSLGGVGTTPEGLWTNYIVYDFTLLQAWGRAPGDDPHGFARRFGARRYGPRAGAAAVRAWDVIYEAAYANTAGPGQPRSGCIANRPHLLSALAPPATGDRRGCYRLGAGWTALLALAPAVGEVKAFRFDLVDVGRDVLTEAFDQVLVSFTRAVEAKNVTGAAMAAKSLLAIIDDYDRLLSTDVNFMLGRWIAMATSWGDSPEERRMLEFNARNQITLWGPKGEILDYATKGWGGLARSFFRPRWELYARSTLEALSAGRPLNRSAFVEEVLRTVELPWQTACDAFPTSPEEDSILVARALHNKYVSSAAGACADPGSAPVRIVHEPLVV